MLVVYNVHLEMIYFQNVKCMYSNYLKNAANLKVFFTKGNWFSILNQSKCVT
jgi:hypothetical protein